MSQSGVVPSIPRRSRLPPTPDIWMPPPTEVQYAAQIKRVQARLAQRAAAKADVAATSQEVPRVPRGARYQRHAFTLESKESSIKVPVRSDKPRAIPSVQLRSEPARIRASRSMDFLIIAPMAPRATRFRAVDDSPLAFSLPRHSKIAPKGILRGGVSKKRRREQKKVSFGDVKTKKVSKWIGILQGIESHNQLFAEGVRCKGRAIHVHSDPCRIFAGNLVGWTRQDAGDDWEYTYLYGQSLPRGSHIDCQNSGCNRRNLYQRQQ